VLALLVVHHVLLIDDEQLLLGQDPEGSYGWISTAVITYSFCILDPFLYCIFET
jgi:hypothetical protein